jgi:hypothetical protein
MTTTVTVAVNGAFQVEVVTTTESGEAVTVVRGDGEGKRDFTLPHGGTILVHDEQAATPKADE